MKTHITILVFLFMAALSSAQPMNNNCDGFGPTWVTGLPYSDMGYTDDAVDDFASCNSFPAGARDVIYTLLLDYPATVRVSLRGSSFDTSLEARTSSTNSCPGDNVVVCNDDYCGLASQIEFSVSPLVAYFMIVQGYEAPH